MFDNLDALQFVHIAECLALEALDSFAELVK